MPSADQLRDALAVIDKDGSGTLTVEELTGVLTMPACAAPMTRTEAERFIAKFDVNGDGVLQIEEFVQALTWSNEQIGIARTADVSATSARDPEGLLKSVMPPPHPAAPV